MAVRVMATIGEQLAWPCREEKAVRSGGCTSRLHGLIEEYVVHCRFWGCWGGGWCARGENGQCTGSRARTRGLQNWERCIALVLHVLLGERTRCDMHGSAIGSRVVLCYAAGFVALRGKAEGA